MVRQTKDVCIYPTEEATDFKDRLRGITSLAQVGTKVEMNILDTCHVETWRSKPSDCVSRIHSDAKTKIPSKWISKTQHVRKKCGYLTALFPQFSSPACLWNEILLSASTESFPVEFWSFCPQYSTHLSHQSRLPTWRLQDLPCPISEPLWNQFCCLGYPIFPLLCSDPVLWLANFYLWKKD